MKSLLTLSFCLLVGSAMAQHVSMKEIITQVQKTYAPDKRTVIFEAEVSEDDKLTGKTSSAVAHEALVEKLKAVQPSLVDEMQVLPNAAVGEKTQAIVNVSVCNIRSAPKHSAELATQALLGTPLNVYEKEGSWLRVQTPDAYISWVDQGAIFLATPAEVENWQKARKLIYLTPYGFSYAEANADGSTISDIVAGDLVAYKGEKGAFYEVAYPDGRKAFIRKADARFYEEWLSSVQISESSLVSTSKKLMGLPYLWGGTSFKGVDCSGFTKTVYFLNGVQLPRDASQQVNSGELVDTTKDWSKLRPGDLLFFGKVNEDGTEKVVHVAMWIGNNQFIHSSNFVMVNSIDPSADHYDEFNVGRYLRTKRIINHYTNALKFSKK
ncbi:hypothetical protein BWI96_17575 [Siphonobacter sp. SORGH_AS_0500]|uniref:C40 family peptidase n=1 Tax=Siphonobacter sp. SORGH_AS_0500 TaxID=1864824 RepID=UPI000CC05E21|nr:C40 family peptidase [Siphonobacter sp. SORGH_AS_0500]PKK35336.1 hypothetical protein BWI96_17575 [Siphonobacter sp. SORGH_AS_0500]